MIRLDIEQVVRQKYKGYIPSFLFKLLAKLIHQDELNEMNSLQTHVDGVAFAEKLVRYFGITTELHLQEPLPTERRCIFVSNHPLGGADGIVLLSLLGRHYQGEVHVLTNDLLKNVSQFDDIFVAVNRYGKQGRERVIAMDKALSSDRHVITFPAGLCSRRNSEGKVWDLDWSPSFLKMARKYDRDIVPIYFDARNSERFYRWAKIRKALGIKFGYEQILLPDELFRARGARYNIYIGKKMGVEELPDAKLDQETARTIRDTLYTFKH